MRSRILLSVVTVVALAVLLGLGTWQIQRLQWKQDLTSKIDARITEAPTSIDAILKLRADGGDIEYRRMRVSGRFDHARTVRVYALRGGKAGWHVYAPLELEDRTFIFVNRGFAPELLDGTEVPLNLPAGSVDVVGLVRQPPAETSVFTPKNDPARRRFYWRDFTNMVAAVHDKTEVSFAPFFLDEAAPVADAASEQAATGRARTWPQPGTTRVKLANRHLEYAITWYGLALALVGVYAFFMFGGRRRNNGDLGT